MTGSMDPEKVKARLSESANDVVNTRESYRGSKTAGLAVGHAVHKHPIDCCSCIKGCFMPKSTRPTGVDRYNVVCIGGGIMSATVCTILQELEPEWKICIVENLNKVGQEASNGWNNAGTGHAALCELNYTPETKGEIDISKALGINEKFLISRQFWGGLVDKGDLPKADTFINNTPHITFVHGDKNIDFLKRRYELLKAEPLFAGMEYTEDEATAKSWAPLLFEGKRDDRVALTRVADGTDVDYGSLTGLLCNNFMRKGGVCNLLTRCTALCQQKDKTWVVRTEKADLSPSGARELHADFVFVGAGGASLQILQKAGIPEIKGFGGFPISGMFLVCQKKEIVDKHPAKIYGKAAVGAPPMSVPHLDKRVIDGKEMILFGPYAGFSPKYLKTGKNTDMFSTISYHNLIPMAAAGLQNLDLTIYLLKELMAGKEKRMMALREFIPDAKPEDWQMTIAGQRVQVMKKDPKKIGILQFGTELVSAKDGTLAGLLGASPGASVAVQVAIDVLATCYPTKIEAWTPKLKGLIPSFGEELRGQPARVRELERITAVQLGLKIPK